MDTEIERIKIKGIILKDLLNKKFIEELRKEGLDLEFAHLTSFMGDENKSDKKRLIPVTLFHTKNEELKDKIMHIDSDMGKNIKTMQKVLEKLVKQSK